LAHAEAAHILQEKFGYDHFRTGQDQAIERVLADENTLVVMPTGGGKSLCYQIPALMLPGLTVVVSPLIALMKDQVDALNDNGIPATFINSSIDFREIDERLRQAAAGEVKLLYVAPERFESEQFVDELNDIKISLLAIDEAHCISQWGHDFRPSYLSLAAVPERLVSHPAVIALTATATPRVAQDIRQRLHIPDDGMVNTGFARDNLSFQVVRGQDEDRYLAEYLKLNQDQSGIIYVSTRKEVERLYTFLSRKKLPVTRYHAGMNDAERAQNQEDFLFDRSPIMIATNAFGMGIDKSNVRFVIHAQVPKDLESYYQEAGRAGRDGLPSEAILLFKPADVQLQHFFIEQSDADTAHKHLQYQKLQTMVQYANTDDCLQQFILRYFGQNDTSPCGRCSNCLDQREAVDVTTDAQKVLSCVVRMHERFGKSLVAQVLAGSNVQRIREMRLTELSTYGLMRPQSQKEIATFIDFLTAGGFLAARGGQYPTLSVTPAGVAVLKGEETVHRKTAVRAHQSVPTDDATFEALRLVRRQLAEENKLPPYMIFPDQTLKAMSSEKPQTLIDMLAIKGVGEAKLDKYGQIFLDALNDQAKQTVHAADPNG
jgi:ATP-dependent DNA helicase RecQ